MPNAKLALGFIAWKEGSLLACQRSQALETKESSHYKQMVAV